MARPARAVRTPPDTDLQGADGTKNRSSCYGGGPGPRPLSYSHVLVVYSDPLFKFKLPVIGVLYDRPNKSLFVRGMGRAK